MRVAGFLLLALLCLLPRESSAEREGEIDLEEPHGSYGELTLERGFRDPASIDVFTGGYRDARRMRLGRGCVGWIAERPDTLIALRANHSWLRVYVTAQGADASLLIRTPSGQWLCNDNSFGGRNPSIDIPRASQGFYRVWVANRRPRSRVRAMVYVTTNPAQHP